MDKLEPLIRHRFWILFGLALPLALAGYFLTSGKMSEARDAREQELEKTLNSVPKGVADPNDTYAAGLKQINEKLQADNKVEVQKLWEAQTPRMHWPTVMTKRNLIPDEYRGEISDAGRRYYVAIYPEVIKRVWEKAQPVVGDPPPYGLEVTWDQKVLLLPETIPLHSLDLSMGTPSNRRIWNAQEDVWLLELLFDGIVRTNENASSIMDATVRSIDALYLTGGDNKPVLAGSGGGPGGGGRRDDDGDGGEFVPFGGGMGAGRAGRAGIGGGSVSFNPAEEFGAPIPDPEFEKEMEAAGFSVSKPGVGGGREDRGDGGEFVPFGGGGGGVGLASQSGDGAYRYIGNPSDVEKAPYRERGFYMSVIVKLSELPGFFAEMSSSEWPIRIMRFQVGPNPRAPEPTSISAAGRSGFGGRGRQFRGDDGEDYGTSGFGRRLGLNRRPTSALGRSMLGGRMGNRSDDDTGGFLGGSFGGSRGSRGGMGGRGVVLPLNMQGPAQIDPNWFTDPDLVQVDFCGIITMYNPQTDDTVVPTADGSSEDATPEALEQREKEIEAAIDEAEAKAAAENPPTAEEPSAEGAAGEAVPPTETEPIPPTGNEPEPNATTPDGGEEPTGNEDVTEVPLSTEDEPPSETP